jgi:uncharacterized Zn-binding protein involved in type VI secretion
MPGKGVQRVGDPNSGGGIAVGPGHTNVLINGRPAAIPATPFTPHVGCSPTSPQHCAGLIGVIPGGVAGAATKAATTGKVGASVFANGIPLVLDGDGDSCIQHSRKFGSTDVRAT